MGPLSEAPPTLRLVAGRHKRVKAGHPWVYSNEIVMSAEAKKLAPGTIVRLEAGSGEPLGLAMFNPRTLIAARVLDRNPSAVIDRAFLTNKIAAAAALRERIYPGGYYRLIHAEADGLPGVIIDRFGDAAVIQPNAAWAEAHIDALSAALQQVTGVSVVIKNGTGRARALEGLKDENVVLAGTLTGPIPVPMNGATYFADLEGGQKTGLFFDQRPNHAFAKRLAKGSNVLDVFSHVGGFALAALAGGAQSALAVDASAPALALAAKGAAASGFANFSTRQGDAFDVLEALGAEGARFDMVVCDPPAFAPNKNALEAGLRAYERVAKLAAGLVSQGGYLVLCSCSHAADLTAFRNACARGIGRGGRKGQLIYTGFAGPDHPMMPVLAESAYLKSLFFRLD